VLLSGQRLRVAVNFLMYHTSDGNTNIIWNCFMYLNVVQ